MQQPQQPQKSRGISGPQLGSGQQQNRGYQGGSGRMRPPQNVSLVVDAISVTLI